MYTNTIWQKGEDHHICPEDERVSTKKKPLQPRYGNKLLVCYIKRERKTLQAKGTVFRKKEKMKQYGLNP